MLGRLWKSFLNRVIQIVVQVAPGERNFRPFLHRMRGVKIGKNCGIARDAIIETAYPNLVSIGDGSYIGIGVIITAHFRDEPSMEDRFKKETVSVNIEKDVLIGPGSIIMPHLTIGEGSVISAGSVVTRSVPAKMLMQGNPAEPVARCGIPLAPLSTTVREFYRNLKPLKSGKGS